MIDIPEVKLMKQAIHDFEKEIKKEKSRIEHESYQYIEEQKQRDLDRVQGMIFAKIFFEKYYKRYVWQMKDSDH